MAKTDAPEPVAIGTEVTAAELFDAVQTLDNLDDVAKYFNRSRRTVYRWMHSPVYLKFIRQRRIAVERMIASRYETRMHLGLNTLERVAAAGQDDHAQVNAARALLAECRLQRDDLDADVPDDEEPAESVLDRVRAAARSALETAKKKLE